MFAAVAAAIDLVLSERKRGISGQQPDATALCERRRLVRLGKSEIVLDILREGEALAVRVVEANGEQGLLLNSNWMPGDPIWSGTINGQPMAMQVRRLVNGFEPRWVLAW